MKLLLLLLILLLLQALLCFATIDVLYKVIRLYKVNKENCSPLHSFSRKDKNILEEGLGIS